MLTGCSIHDGAATSPVLPKQLLSERFHSFATGVTEPYRDASYVAEAVAGRTPTARTEAIVTSPDRAVRPAPPG
jgi:hypothetical protein